MRLIGVGLILGAALWFGAYFAAQEKYRLQELETLRRCIHLLQSQIAYLAAPLPEALESVGQKTDGTIALIFSEAAARMAARTGETAEELWAAVWQAHLAQTYLTAADHNAVLQFGKTLGYLDRAQQEGSIRLFAAYLTEEWTQGKKRLEKNGRLYYGVSGLCGLLLVVTLL